MPITPSTNLKLLKCHIELDNKNQLTFASKQAQYNYFNSLPSTSIIEDSYYQRKDSYIEYPAHIDDIIEYNYCMYQNENYTDKWFYCYITNMEYINDGTTRVYIETDVFQTWQFDFTWKQSFIVREMINVNEDSPSANLIPESFEIGDPIQVKSYTIPELAPLCVMAYAGDELKIEDVGTTTTYHFTGGKYNNIPSFVLFLVGTADCFEELLLELNSDQRSQNIMSLFTIPKFTCPSAIDNPITNADYTALAGNFESPTFNYTLSDIPETIDGYTPKNKKLLQYPYRYIGFSPSSGAKKIFKIEDFSSTPSFRLASEINQNPQVCFIPYNYKGRPLNNADYGTMTGYPTLSWRTDYFNAWLASSHESINLDYQREHFNYKNQETMLPIDIAGNIASAIKDKDYGSAFKSGVNTGYKASTMKYDHEYNQKKMVAQVKQAQLMPDSGSVGSNANTMLGEGLSATPFFIFNIKRQFAERIDKFWDCYGYQTNIVKIPNTHNRPNWNYVKTEGANIIGNFPQEDLQTLKSIFDSGVTLWHNSSTFLDYSQNNR